MTALNIEANVKVGAAERRAMKISLRLDTIADNFEAVMPMIREAIELRDDVALGYRSPGDYVRDRFGNALSRLPLELRRETVKELTEAGLSTRAIAPVVGVHKDTVRNDLKSGGEPSPPVSESGGANATPDAEPVEPDIDPAHIDYATGEVLDAPDAEPERKPVTGIDGKTYKQPEPRKRQDQRSDAETYLNLAQTYAAKAATEALKLTPSQIDRVKPNAALWVGGISESIETLQRLVTSLEMEN